MKKYLLLFFILILTACSAQTGVITEPQNDNNSQLLLTDNTIEVVALDEEVASAPVVGNISPEPDQSVETIENDAELESLTSDNFHIGVGLKTNISQAQMDFINRNMTYVMTPILNESIRNAITGPQLILYRSIQGTWDGFNHFDWEHIDSNENMFLHHQGERILTLWHSWLMNPNDQVNPDDSDALDHWINYYAITASNQVYAYDYDGLFVDSASHQLRLGAVHGKMPDDYDRETWYQGRAASLAFIKSYLPDKSVVFNGLHSQSGEEDSLTNTDGGMWETFAFHPVSGEYQGESTWQTAIELTSRNSTDKKIVLVVKEQPDLNEDIPKRIFSVASYLLVSNENVVFSMTDKGHIQTKSILYYPEYTLDLGAALSNYEVKDGLYMRKFEKGLVLVNSNENQQITYALDGNYVQVIPVGGGAVPEEGTWQGSLSYESVSGTVTLLPISAMILINPQD